MEWIQAMDWALLEWIVRTFHGEANDRLMPVISLLGNGGAVWLLAAGVLLLTRRYRAAGLTLLLGIFAGFLIGNEILKNVVARPRPCWLYPDLPLLVPVPVDYSFPSGHTLSSVIAASLLTKENKWFGLPAIPLAGLIAFSRLYLYVHFPTDILASLVLGLLISAAAGALRRRFFPGSMPSRSCDGRASSATMKKNFRKDAP